MCEMLVEAGARPMRMRRRRKLLRSRGGRSNGPAAEQRSIFCRLWSGGISARMPQVEGDFQCITSLSSRICMPR